MSEVTWFFLGMLAATLILSKVVDKANRTLLQHGVTMRYIDHLEKHLDVKP